MKRFWLEAALAVALGVLFPWILFSLTDPAVQGALSAQPAGTSQPTITQPETTKVWVLLPDGQAREMDLEEYLVGVVLGEMPADFEMEALKAQSVVARTFALRAQEQNSKHPGMVCTDAACCQAYCAPADYLAQGGEEAAVDKVTAAVQATWGQVLCYQGELIEATYFSCSGGRTEDALAVWGADVPYLRSTESPGEEGAAHYTDRVFFTPEEFSQALGGGLTGSPDTWFGETSYTAGGGVEEMAIGGRIYRGTELRRLLGLRSTAFTVEAGAAGIWITTHGFGHRVGMSQYGADAMAAAGADYASILAHYYQGTTLETRKT